MKFLALVAIASALTLDVEESRDLAGAAANEEAAWKAWEESQKAVRGAQAAYLAAKREARKQEAELAREIKETQDQEKVVKQANDKANAARRALFKATFASHKAFEAYEHAMNADALVYTK